MPKQQTHILAAEADSALVALVQEHGREADAAFREIYRRYSDRLYRYCLNVVSGDARAEDLLQDTFLKFLTAVRKGDVIENVPAFLMRITRNLCLDFKRSDRMDFVDPSEIEIVSHDVSLDDEEIQTSLATAIAHLPDAYREALVMHVYGGLSYAEICDATDSSLPAVRNRISRARTWLRSALLPLFKD